MARSQRLLDLLQVLRRYRTPVSGKTLAQETGVSLRTLYRDIASLQAHGANIEGEAGVGYVLRPGFMLPPMMFSPEEIEALVLGSRWVAKRADESLAAAAIDALAKIANVLPESLRDDLDESTLFVGPRTPPDETIDLEALRTAIRNERKLEITYVPETGPAGSRTVWPFALAFFEDVRVVACWCELRKGFRHFRADRIASLKVLDERYPRRRPVLLKEWRKTENIGGSQTADRN